MINKKLLIVYPYLPNYRMPFFILLRDKLKIYNIDLIICSGSNIGKKKVMEPEIPEDLRVYKQKRVGISLFDFQVQWQKELIETITKEKPDFAVYMYNAGILNYSISMLYLKIKNIPYYVWTSGHKRFGLSKGKHKIKDFFKFYFVNSASGIISYSNYFKSKLIESGYPAQKVTVAQNTVALPTKNFIINKDYQIIKFLFVGNIIEDKKLDILIYSIKKLSNSYTNLKCDIVGDGYYLETLKNKVSKLNLEEYIIFHGAKFGKEVSDFFINSNIFVLPGTGGLAINEALFYGLPIISTPGDGTGFDLVIEGKNGFLLDFNPSVDQLSKVMEYFLKCKKEEIRKMESFSVEISKSITLENMVESFIKPFIN